MQVYTQAENVIKIDFNNDYVGIINDNHDGTFTITHYDSYYSYKNDDCDFTKTATIAELLKYISDYVDTVYVESKRIKRRKHGNN